VCFAAKQQVYLYTKEPRIKIGVYIFYFVNYSVSLQPKKSNYK